MPSSISRLVALDHERLTRLLRRACSSGPSQQRWRDELVHLYRAHAQAEDEVLAAVVGETLQGRLEDLAGRRRLEELVRRVADAGQEAELRDAGALLAGALTDHAVAVHERVLVPLEQSVSRKEVRRLGGAYAQSRDRSLREQGEAGPPPRRLDLSRAELYELAKKAGIEGRSSMSRRDLIDRLMQQERSR